MNIYFLRQYIKIDISTFFLSFSKQVVVNFKKNEKYVDPQKIKPP